MKFTISSIRYSKLRLGKLTNISRLPALELETPLLLLYTKGGSIPHVTREVFDLLSQEQAGIQITLPSTIQCLEGAKAFGKGIAEFIGFKEMLTYCSVQDSAITTPEGYNTKEEISVWSHTGKIPVTVDRFMDIIEAFQPDFYQVLSNGDTNKKSTRKKSKKVLDSSHKLLDKCLERHKSSSVLTSAAVFGSIEGGYELDFRNISAQVLSSKPVNGFVINGFHNNGPEVENIDFEKVIPLLEATLKHLPEDKPRIIHGCWRPEHVLRMVDMGMDIFDSSLVYVATERKSALIFQYHELLIESDEIGNFDTRDYDTVLEICLESKSYKEDFNPILDGCSCLTCRKHTRAYIHHLIINKELLSSTLLMLHNLHHYLLFFKSIRKAASDGKRLSITK